MFKIAFIKRLKQINLKVFLFFLVLSVMVWLLVQFAESYEDTFEFPLELVNQPKDKILDFDDGETVSAKIDVSGFQILGLKFSNPKIEIDLAEVDERNGSFVYSIYDNKEELVSQFGLKPNDISFLKDTITISYSQKATKTVAVQAISKISYGLGYAKDGIIKLSPDSITVSGKKSILDTLTTIKTRPIKLKDVTESLTDEIAIDTSNLDGLTLFQDKTSYSLKISKFTEGKLNIPVTLLNVPGDIAISIFPKEVTIIYQTTLEAFPNIDQSDFKVTEDYDELKKGGDFFIPKVTKKPEAVTSIKIANPKVQYIIKQ